MFETLRYPLWLMLINIVGIFGAVIGTTWGIMYLTIQPNAERKKSGLICFMVATLGVLLVWGSNAFYFNKIEEVKDVTIEATIINKGVSNNSTHFVLEDAKERYILPTEYVKDADAYVIGDEVKVTIPKIKYEGNKYYNNHKKITIKLIK